MKNTINSTNKHDLNRMSKKDRKWVFTWAFRFFFLSRTNIMHKSFRTKSPVLFGANVNSQKIHAANKPPAKSIWIFPAFCEFLSRSCVAQLMQLHPSFFCWEAVKKSCKLFFFVPFDHFSLVTTIIIGDYRSQFIICEASASRRVTLSISIKVNIDLKPDKKNIKFWEHDR